MYCIEDYIDEGKQTIYICKMFLRKCQTDNKSL